LAVTAAFAVSGTAAYAGEQLPLTAAPAVKAAPVAPGPVPHCTSWCAAINADASIYKAHNYTTAQHIGTGIYQVNFYTSATAQKNISACVWTATPGYGPFSGDLAPSFLTIAGRAGTTNGVWIHTFNSAGTSTDLPFLLVVSC
jgi:hypothetical protein